MSKATWIKLAAVVLAIGVVFGLMVSGVVPVGEWLTSFNDWVRQQGLWGQALFVLLYVVCTVLLVPGSVLTLGAGATFGLVTGTALVIAGSVAGATAAFWVGRTIARRHVEKMAQNNPKFDAVDRAVSAHGFKIVVLTRLSPAFPFTLLNYLFALTQVPTWKYVLGSLVGMFPGTVMYVYLGWAAGTAATVDPAEIGEANPYKYVLQGVGLIATIAVTVYVTHVARRAIRQYVPEDKPEPAESDGRDADRGPHRQPAVEN